jgi:hypothetical protein
MATKKKKGAKRKDVKKRSANEVEKPDLTNQQIFDDFGVGTESASLPMRKFIIGQRTINGHLYTAIDTILEHLTKDGTTPALEEAKLRSDAIPDVPPACCRSKLGCN